MSPRERIYEMLCLASSDKRNFPATIFYNEGWLLRLVVDWFSRQPPDLYLLSFMPDAKWFSEALLPSRFLARPGYRPDTLAEGYTHADGVIGHVDIGSAALAKATLSSGASQFLVIEAKLFSPLSPGVTHARNFDQAARTIACMAEMLSRANRDSSQLSSLAFFVIAPSTQIRDKIFGSLLSQASIRQKVHDRVAQYATYPDGKKKREWLERWFEPTLEHIKIEAITWEKIIAFIRENDAQFGSELSQFYDECRKFNRLQEPDKALESEAAP